MNLACARALFQRYLGGNAPIWSVLVVPTVFIAAVYQLSASAVDPDYWWHVTTGRWMLDNLRIPTTDPFSATHAGQNWYAHEWFAELLFGVINRIAGYAGEIVVTGAIVAAGGWLLARAARYYGLGAREAFILVALSGFFLLNFLAVRPQVWGWALLALLLHELAADDNDRRKSLWYVPLIFAVWVNVHLSVELGGGVLALYVLHRCLLWLFKRRDPALGRRALGTIGIAALSALALCLNPRGPALIWFTRVYLNQNAERYHYISEWQQPSFIGNYRYLFVAGAVIVLLTALAMVRRWRLWPGILVVVFAFAALRAVRYVPMFAIVSIPALGWVFGRFRGRTTTLKEIAVPTWAFGAATAVLLLGVWVVGWLNGSIEFRREPNPYPGAYPVAAAAWIKANVPTGTIFNEYGWGGFLIYTFYPEQRVFMDGREEMYGETFFKHFVETVSGGLGWQRTLEQAGVTATVLSPNTGLAIQLASDPGWVKAYGDSVAVVYVPVQGLAP